MKKSKGERLNWELISNQKRINVKEFFNKINGKIITEDELKDRKGVNDNNIQIVP